MADAATKREAPDVERLAYTVEQSATAANEGHNAIRAACRTGALPHYRKSPNGRILIPLESLRAWIAGRAAAGR